MKIAIVSKANASGGGASRVAEDLAAWLIEAGHQVDHFCATIYGAPREFQSLLIPGLGGRLVLYLHRKTRRLGFNEAIPFEYLYRSCRSLAGYDAVHFHDHCTAFSLVTAGWLAKKTRAFFTAHDCLHFTGDDIFFPPLGPVPGRESPPVQISRRVNRQVAEQSPLTYLYPSQWLMNEAKARLHFLKEPVWLPNGFNPAPYDFIPRLEARRRLALPAGQRIICISAHYLSAPHKGVEFALRAVVACRDLNPLVIFVGSPLNGVEERLPGVQFWFAGYVESRRRLGLLFAAADVFLMPTLRDNLPILVQETMGAATPVVGFATGGIPEMVTDGKSAWLVPTGDQAALDRVLREALLSNAIEERGQAARANLLENFSVERCVRAHEELYRNGGRNAEKRNQVAGDLAH